MVDGVRWFAVIVVVWLSNNGECTASLGVTMLWSDNKGIVIVVAFVGRAWQRLK